MEDKTNLHPTSTSRSEPADSEKRPQEEKLHRSEETGPSRTTAANPNARFELINIKKDEGNFLFREKKYAAALERYIEAMLELKVYRRVWRENRLRKIAAGQDGVPSACSLPTERVPTSKVLGKRTCSGSDKGKGKEKMELEGEEVATAEEKECEKVGNAPMLVEGEETTQTCTSSSGKSAESSTATLVVSPATHSTTAPPSDDTMVDWDGLRRKRRRLDEAECKSDDAATDDMTVEIIDKSDYTMPKDMGCHVSSSSSTSSSSVPSSLAVTAPVVPDWGKHRSFKDLTECEKNLKRLEIIIRLNVAACGIRLGRGQQALEQCRKVVRMNDLECCEPLLYAKALYRKAQSLKVLGQNKEACACLRLATTFSPADRSIRNELSALEQAVKKGSVVCRLLEKLRCKKQDDAEDEPQTSPAPEAPKSNKCTFFSGLFGGSCFARTPLSLLCRREISSRGLTPQQKADVACRQLPKGPPSLVDKYCRRAYAGQWSSDGDLLFTTCQDWKIRIYTHDSKTLTRRCIVNAKKGQWTITDALISSDKTFLLYSSITPLVHVVPLPQNLNDVNPKGDHPVLNFVGAQGSDYSGIWCMALAPDDREVLAGTSDSSVCVYDLEKNQLVERAAAHGDDVNAICYVDTDNGVGSSAHLLASASDDGLIYLWDKRCMTNPVGTLFGHTEGLTSLASKGDGRYLLSNSKDQTMKLWDLRKMVDRHSAQPPVKKYVWDYRGMSYPGHPDVDRHPCDLSVSTFLGHSVLRTLIRCKFSPPAWSDQRYACTASADGKVYIYDVASTQLVRVYDPTGGNETTGSSSAIVRDLSWHPYLPYLVTAAWNGSVSLFSHEAKPDEGSEEERSVLGRSTSG